MISRLQLIQQIKQKKSFLCVGLDSDIDKIPEFLKQYPDQLLHAVVHPQHQRSQRVLNRLGFTPLGSEVIYNQEMSVFTLPPAV